MKARMKHVEPKPRQQDSLTAQDSFGKIIDVIPRRFYCLSLFWEMSVESSIKLTG
jgi:hypothetical protein